MTVCCWVSNQALHPSKCASFVLKGLFKDPAFEGCTDIRFASNKLRRSGLRHKSRLRCRFTGGKHCKFCSFLKICREQVVRVYAVLWASPVNVIGQSIYGCCYVYIHRYVYIHIWKHMYGPHASNE